MTLVDLRNRHVHVARAVAAAALVVLVGLVVPGRVDAAYSSCRSDPIVLVNGTAFDIVSTLATTPSAVKELDYVVTVPSGSLLGGLILTVGLGFPEKVTYMFSSAQPWGTIKVAATVVTQTGVAPFSTSVQVSSLLTAVRSASGWSNGTVIVNTSGLMLL